MATTPLLEQIDALTEAIHLYDLYIVHLAHTQYPETKRLEQVNGVGTLTALAFVLTLHDPQRFPHSREVGCYLGLRPKQDQSGERSAQLGISKAGDVYLRCLLVNAAQHILGPFGQDSDLRRWGLRLAEHGGQNAKRRAVVAVARKLAVLLHRLWVTQAPYEPLRQSQAAAPAQPQAA